MQKLGRAVRRVAAWLLVVIIFFVAVVGSYALYADIHWPRATGNTVKSKGDLTVDLSNASDGYVMAKAAKSKKRLKLRVVKGDDVLTYDLNTSGEYEAFPLQLGSGNYKFELYRNVEGKKYAQNGTVSFSADLSSEYAAYLVPNQYVNYDENSEAVRLSDEICAGLETDRQKVEAVRKYVAKNFVYDYVKATTITAGTMPSIEELLQKKMGICQDIAAITACMLRVQGIPTQMVIGQADRSYHAWNSVLIEGEFLRLDLTAEINAVYRNVAYTAERYY